MRLFLLPVALACLILPASTSDSGAHSKERNALLLFSSDSIPEITLSSDFHLWLNKMRTDSLSHAGILSYTEKGGKRTELHVTVRIRGVFRRNPDNCNFPPLRIVFNEKETRNTLFRGIRSIKLVTHCRSNNRFYEQSLVQEYLVYKMYNSFTDYSFRVRMAGMHYVEGMDSISQLGFFIEPASSVAVRNNCHELEVQNIHPNHIQQKHATMLALFQYMIGNTDWSVPALHNIVLLQKKDELPFAIPFDFDCAGIVNSPYAVPQPSLGIHSVRERLFRGFCRTEEEFNACFQAFEENYNQIMELYSECELLSIQNRKKSIRYLEEYFETIREPRKARSYIIDHCRQE